VSQPIDIVVCGVCHLTQFNRGDGKCRRCHNPLKVIYIELVLPTPLAYRNSQHMLSMRKDFGRLIRKMRLRRGMTQATLASATTGISRTYLSRLENGRVMPSVIVLIKLAAPLGIDKVTLRMRSSVA
jgi:DNA-binding XRE family transcriptional regulator